MALPGPQLRAVQARALDLHQAPALPHRWYLELTDLEDLGATRPDTDRRSHRCRRAFHCREKRYG